jgi:D-sedoheptulose 7-phosphate isomerase
MSKKNEIEIYTNSYLKRLNDIFNNINYDELTSVIELMLEAFKNNKTVYVAGNGGSASTASHMQSDFGFFLRNRTPFRPKILSLTDNLSLITAIGNDASFDDIFMEQLNGKFNTGDILIVISASGNSKNVINAVEYVNSIDGDTVAFTGFSGGKLSKLAKYSVHTPNVKFDYGPIEDMHLIFMHIIINFLSQDQDFLAIR